MANLHIHIDDHVQREAQAITKGMGIDVNTAVSLFLTQMVRERALPFMPSLDPFYSSANQKHLKRLAEDMDANKNCAFHELIEA